MHHGKRIPGTLGALAQSGIAFVIQCDACLHSKEFYPKSMVIHLGGWGVTIPQIEARFRCSRCARKQAKLRRER